MHIKKRDGRIQKIDLNKIVNRLQLLIDGYDENKNKIGEILNIDPISIATKVCGQLTDGLTTTDLDNFSAETCAYMVGDHLHYGLLADRLSISSHHKNTFSNFSDIIEKLYQNNQINDSLYKVTIENKSKIDKIVNDNHINDYYTLNYFGNKMLIKSYYLKVRDNVDVNKILYMERLQHVFMRVCLSLHLDDIDMAIYAYNNMTQNYYIHATPTLFNAGTRIEQLSSCYLGVCDDSLFSMYNKTISNLSEISKKSGGVGISISDIRANGSLIKGTNGISTGIMPYLKTLNNTISHVNQGGKRNGSLACYIEPWHADIVAFLHAKKNTGVDEMRARDLFYGLWVPDLFMERWILAKTTSKSVKWSLMCPNTCQGLTETYGKEFKELYEQYEKHGMYVSQMEITELFDMIVSSQIETGGPYICYKDHVNEKSAQSNLGTIKCSNLCTEIMEYSNSGEYATCNLASINLKSFVKNKEFDFQKLEEISALVCNNLNKVIDINIQPVKESSRSTFKHRSIGIGVQGLADTFIEMGYPFTSNEARELNVKIFETIYYGALKESNKLAKIRHDKLSSVNMNDLIALKSLSSIIEFYTYSLDNLYNENKSEYTYAEQDFINEAKSLVNDSNYQINSIINKYDLPKSIKEYQFMNFNYKGAYASFEGSPASKGILQFDMWNVKNDKFMELKKEIMEYGLRNSLLTTIMPTASTASIFGNTECIEPISSVFYVKQTLSGSFIVINKQLHMLLTNMGLWSTTLKNRILSNDGSIQNIKEIPNDIKKLFLTAYEISKKEQIDIVADRSPYIDQAQSLNHFLPNATKEILENIHKHTWDKGLKTGSYYIRTKTVVSAKKFSIAYDKESSIVSPKIQIDNKEDKEEDIKACSRNNPNCESCSG